MMITVCMVIGVDILLLSASGKMAGLAPGWGRILVGALLHGLLTGLELFFGLQWTGNILCRLLELTAASVVCFGFRSSLLPAAVLFAVLHLSLGNLTQTEGGYASGLLGAAGIALACSLTGAKGKYVQVCLKRREKTLRFTALRDTGNELTDPLTGEPVLVVGESVARELTGLTGPELADPVNSIALVPGSRLIPYQTVGGSGFLLALRIADARVGNRQGSVLVALSPNALGKNYQGLTGGMLR